MLRNFFIFLGVVLCLNIAFAQTEALPNTLSNPLNDRPLVIIRVDDFQDDWLTNAQINLLSFLIKNNIKATLSLIPAKLKADSALIKEIKKGVDKSLFEIAVHSFDHERLTELNFEEQQKIINLALESLENLGFSSEVFVPPYSVYDDNTTKALASHKNIKIISSDVYYEPPPYPFREGDPLFHLPSTVGTADLKDSLYWINFSPADLIRKTKKSIELYGFAVMIFHPQQFVEFDEKTKKYIDLPSADFELLPLIISEIKKNNWQIGSFAELKSTLENK